MVSLFLKGIPFAYNAKSFAITTVFAFACNAKSFAVVFFFFFSFTCNAKIFVIAVILSTTVANRVVTYHEGLPPVNSQNPLIK